MRIRFGTKHGGDLAPENAGSGAWQMLVKVRSSFSAVLAVVSVRCPFLVSHTVIYSYLFCKKFLYLVL